MHTPPVVSSERSERDKASDEVSGRDRFCRCSSAPPAVLLDDEPTSGASVDERRPSAPVGSVVRSRTIPPPVEQPTKSMSSVFLLPTDDRTDCELCGKSFRKVAQLRNHMNVHYLEQSSRNRYVYACRLCRTSLRSKALLLKHLETVHYQQADSENPHLTSPGSAQLCNYSQTHTQTSSNTPALNNNPRPFTCTDCDTGFRIHGHLAKHLRSKIHVMKLENQGKLPAGTVHRMESKNNAACLNDVDTTDCERALVSLRQLASYLLSEHPPASDANSPVKHDEPAATATTPLQDPPSNNDDLKCSERLVASPVVATNDSGGGKLVVAGVWTPPTAHDLSEEFARRPKSCALGDGAKLLLDAAAFSDSGSSLFLLYRINCLVLLKMVHFSGACYGKPPMPVARE